RGGATLIFDVTGTPVLIIRQRIDNRDRLGAETAYLRTALGDGRMILREGRYVPDPALRRGICAGH
ncbi:MAG: hypothetical protein L0G27_05860, partial [Paracoccus sp. (in: a-proteobacteria)]|nr:hypothetical protein [Paracoccus sp. (in: a-proteobacteria)]